jgi:sulfonate dioxygenase
MAPSATETLPVRTEPSFSKLGTSIGPYKELAPIGYEKQAEIEGKDGFQAAKVG